MLTHLKSIMILDTLLLLSKTSPSHKVEAKVRRCKQPHIQKAMHQKVNC